MILGDLINTIKNINICIMTTDSEHHTKIIYEGESRFFRIEPYEDQLKVLYIAPHKFNSDEIFIMCEE